MQMDRTAENWLILTDYASKYKVSVSTLRRRIKTDTIKHKFEAGRYLLADEAPTGGHHSMSAPAGSLAYPPRTSHFAPIAPAAPLQTSPQSIEAEVKLKELGHGATASDEEPILSTATRLLNELKRAYSNILHEKEEQMIQLKEEVSDLKTLVRVLESDNDRMRGVLQKWGSA